MRAMAAEANAFFQKRFGRENKRRPRLFAKVQRESALWHGGSYLKEDRVLYHLYYCRSHAAVVDERSDDNVLSNRGLFCF